VHAGPCAQVGGYGEGDGQFKGAEALALGLAGGAPCLFVADYGNHRVVALSPDTLAFRFAIGSHGSVAKNPAHLLGPSGVACRAHQLFVADHSRRVLQFDMTSVHGPWCTSPPPPPSQLSPTPAMRAFCAQALGPVLVRTMRCVDDPIGLALGHGRLYAAETRGRVLAFDLQRREERQVLCRPDEAGRFWGVFADPDDLRLYATAAGERAIAVFCAPESDRP